jgi:ABC-2 type transport system ATP-binding protein
MGDWTDRRVGKFSKGMKQRVNIAAALLHDPNVLILDEPATGLDPRGMAEVRDIVRGLKKRNRLVFLSSHILQEVVDVCDEVALIDKGKLLFYDTLANVTSKFADGNPSFDVGLARPLASDATLKDVAALPGVTSAEILEPRRLRIRFRGGPEAQETLLASLVALRIGVTSFSEPVSALEDIYLKQISRGD